MLQLQYIEFAEKQLPSLDLDRKQDIIKLEKILKAEAKLNPLFNINDIEALISFIHAYGTQFFPLIKHKNIAIILKGEGGYINPAPFKGPAFEESLLVEFREVFGENILNYFKSCIHKNNWVNTKSVFKIYPFLLNDDIVQEVLETISLKNQAIISALRSSAYASFVNKHEYASDVAYFILLSDIDEYYFEDEILAINNIIAEKQKEKGTDKVALGKILYAATHYKAFSTALASTLESNQDIAHGWVYPYREKPFIWTSGNIIALIIAILIGIVILVLLPTKIGGITWIAVIIGRLAFTLLKK